MKCKECDYAADYIDDGEVDKKQCDITDEVHEAEFACNCEVQRRKCMIVNKSKYCNGCHDRVAVKHCILWHTIKDYVTIRGDDVPTYVNYEDATTPVKLHYCRECWNTITKNLPFESEVLPF